MSQQDKKLAMDAVGAAREVHEEAWKKLGKVIAQKLMDEKKTDQENRLRARASRQIARYNRRLLELKAASVVVNPPTVARIREVRAIVKKVREIAVKDAMLKKGLKLINDAMATARDVAKAARTG